MKFAISLFVLIAILGTSAKQQTTPPKVATSYKVDLIVDKDLVKDKHLIKPSESMIKALKELEYKSVKCDKTVNKILKSQKDSLSLIAHKN